MIDEVWSPLAGIETMSGTADDGNNAYRGFVTIRAVAEDGSVMIGQVDPGTCRELGMQFLETAEAADQDAIVFKVMTRQVEMTPAEVAQLVMAMRYEREAAGHEGVRGG